MRFRLFLKRAAGRLAWTALAIARPYAVWTRPGSVQIRGLATLIVARALRVVYGDVERLHAGALPADVDSRIAELDARIRAARAEVRGLGVPGGAGPLGAP